MQNNKELSVIILASNYIPRMKSYGPPCLFKDISGISILEHQIKLFQRVFTNPEIIVVTGLWADRIAGMKTNEYRIIENPLYETSNEVENIRLAINNLHTDNVLIVPGDLYFNTSTLTNIPNDSFVIYDSRNQLENSPISMTVLNKNVTTLSFDLPNKYSGIAYINKDVFPKFKRICLDRSKSRLFLFELINNLIEQDIMFKAFEPSKMHIIKITSIHDLQKCKELILR